MKLQSIRPSTTVNGCTDCPIRPRAVCAHCNDAELVALDRIKHYKTWKAGETIVHEGAPLDFAASVVTGCATLSRSLEDGRRQIVGLLLPSDFIGRPGRARSEHAIEAASDVTLCTFRRAPFEALLQESPRIASRLLAMSLDELDATREWMLLLGRKTAREKVATFLLALLRRTATGPGPYRTDLPLSREEIATFLGLTIETVSRQLTSLRKDGVIGLDGLRTVTCADLQRLGAESGAEVAEALLP
ncbi:transcriptional regulator FnrL [Jannaschia seohaensis]|uniref:CRP/FNR family transcriptional regulator n=1 Tax=Jannaschia seohaensis TaxID=475081 RepID=A0A2Y9BWA6_9RHOB|nr:helix-turn-helix domain-containing protein [Jannaschia seohaensis]PWJ22464.1 CRP/FNR family transcriptional regulator [Jannaschia seohaensis]SSA38742.1 CRP/FNR family transcriptional regulator, anaerobic regulatory protein [Jannaschia seohaensis]